MQRNEFIPNNIYDLSIAIHQVVDTEIVKIKHHFNNKESYFIRNGTYILILYLLNRLSGSKPNILRFLVEVRERSQNKKPNCDPLKYRPEIQWSCLIMIMIILQKYSPYNKWSIIKQCTPRSGFLSILVV